MNSPKSAKRKVRQHADKEIIQHLHFAGSHYRNAYSADKVTFEFELESSSLLLQHYFEQLLPISAFFQQFTSSAAQHLCLLCLFSLLGFDYYTNLSAAGWCGEWVVL